MTAHTPGPWIVERAIWDEATEDVAYVLTGNKLARTEDALLIGAAPDLLDANRACLAACVECAGNLDYDCTRAPCPQVRAAIAKAKAGP